MLRWRGLRLARSVAPVGAQLPAKTLPELSELAGYVPRPPEPEKDPKPGFRGGVKSPWHNYREIHIYQRHLWCALWFSEFRSYRVCCLDTP